LIENQSKSREPTGELFTCAYTPDGAFVLTGGYDGFLRLWETTGGMEVTAFQAANRPISAATVSPDGKYWLTGNLDGMFAIWDPVSQQQIYTFLAHPRPIAGIVYSADGNLIATAAWDGTLNVWTPGQERERRVFAGHTDIVAGCRFTPSGKSLLSWSFDHTVRLWEVARVKLVSTFAGHAERVTAGAVSPDGHWAATGSLDGDLKIWDLQADLEAASINLGSEIRGLAFLLDLETMIVVAANGKIELLDLSSLESKASLMSGVAPQCADLSPTSSQIALGSEDGHLYLVDIEEMEGAVLLTNVIRNFRRTQSALQKLTGTSTTVFYFTATCPACRSVFEVYRPAPGQMLNCARCQRQLKINPVNFPGS
jgi:WD40 repeat protein